MRPGLLSKLSTSSSVYSPLLQSTCPISVDSLSTRMQDTVNLFSSLSLVLWAHWLLSLSLLLRNISGVNTSGLCLLSLQNSIAAQPWYLFSSSRSNSFIVLHWVCHGNCDNGKSDCCWCISLW